MLIFDIETEALPEEQLRELAPAFEPPPHPGEFDPASVKYGQTKDPAKRAAKLDEEQAKHAALVANYEATIEQARADHWRKVVESASLDPTTGRVLAIGCLNTSGAAGISNGDEREILTQFWGKYVKLKAENRSLIGANIFGFDLPFLVRRSWILSVDVPRSVRSFHNGRLYWDPLFIDIRDVWLCGQRWGECESSLDVIGRALGLGGKLDGVTGGDFARLWRGTPEERERAKQYLLRDLELTALVANKLGVIV